MTLDHFPEPYSPREAFPDPATGHRIARRAGITALAAVAAFGAVKVVGELASHVGEAFIREIDSTGNQTVVVQRGDTLWELVNKHVAGLDEVATGDVVWLAMSDPANTEALSDGLQLQPGEVISLPESVRYE